jgi:clan AA aspartic protease
VRSDPRTVPHLSFCVIFKVWKKEMRMGLVYSEIVLKNALDVGKAREGSIPEKAVRAVSVNALVDTGAGTLVINEETRQKLGLTIESQRHIAKRCEATLADGASEVYKVTEPVKICWENRDTACRALVIPGANKILLGAIPLEDMDLIIDPQRQKLTGAHGDDVVCLVM